MMSAVAPQLSAFYGVEEKVSSLALTYPLFSALILSLNIICLASKVFPFTFTIAKKQPGLEGQSECEVEEKAGHDVIILIKMSICVNLKP